MNPIDFQNVSFGYDGSQVLTNVSVTIPPGVTSLTGPNGSGKTTFLLLASGRLVPDSGIVRLEGQNTATLDDGQKNQLASLVYQNMEFENEEPLGELLDFVVANGFLGQGDPTFQKAVVTTFDLSNLLTRKTQTLSKGEMQRAVMAFSVLYGSRVVVMDEPVFALEGHQKRTALGFLAEHARATGRSFLYSAHELDLTKDFSDRVLLFSKDAVPRLGTAAELLTREVLEQAYQVPYILLHQREQLYRSTLLSLKPDRP